MADLLLRIPQIDEFYDRPRRHPARGGLIGVAAGQPGPSASTSSAASGRCELLLFLAGVVFAIGFTLGYRTRLCAVVSWFLVMSMQVRTGIVLHGGDDLIRRAAVLVHVRPAQRTSTRSIGRSTPTRRPLPLAHLSPGSLALMFQICAMYWYTAAEKMHPVWLTERSAVYYALSLDQFATPLGHFLLGYPALLPVLTTATLVLEFFGPDPGAARRSGPARFD